MRTRKSSLKITLVLIGALPLAGCYQAPLQRNLYASKEDCLADWGNQPSDCEEARDQPRTRSGSYHYWGRTYGGGDVAHQSTRAVGKSTVSRGGFGASAHSSSS